MRSKVEVRSCIDDGTYCRWCSSKGHWITNAYAKSTWGAWAYLCDKHLGALLRKIGVRSLRYELPEPVVTVDVER